MRDAPAVFQTVSIRYELRWACRGLAWRRGLCAFLSGHVRPLQESEARGWDWAAAVANGEGLMDSAAADELPTIGSLDV